MRSNPNWTFLGLGKKMIDECGCETISYPGGKTISTGCNKHRSNKSYVCQVCFKKCNSEKELSKHRWEHSY